VSDAAVYLNEPTENPRETSPSVSFVIPCLNEAQTIGHVMDEIHATMRTTDFSYEIVVADNGSTDGSQAIAHSHGGRVLPVPERGYGNALRHGIAGARGDIVVMLDADFTYDASFAPALISLLLTSDASLVLGSRLRGSIDAGAMPPLHRFVGTPVLTWIINRLFRGCISDCNSGMRAFLRTRFAAWQVSAPGMEFASEMIVEALRRGDRVAEIPIRFRQDRRDRAPHLRRWSDGMRHLLFILSRAPAAFARFGLTCMAIGFVVSFLCLFGPITLWHASVFGYHTAILAILLGFFGAQAFTYALVVQAASDKVPPIPGQALLKVEEGALFWSIVASVALLMALLVFLLVSWSNDGFASLGYLSLTLFVTYLITVVGSLAVGTFGAHMAKRAVR
jgi:hypothetical protein